jgi:hypothetical protein
MIDVTAPIFHNENQAREWVKSYRWPDWRILVRLR